MIDERGDVKLIDFGLSARAAADEPLSNSCGYVHYDENRVGGGVCEYNTPLFVYLII